jgi:hypothetical protein
MEPFDRTDYYKILQVDPRAHPEIIRSAYRTLLRVMGKHPDLGGDSTEARSIIAAYSTLSDARRREAYDRWLRVHSAPHAAPPTATAPAPPPPPPTPPAPPPAPPSLNWIRDALPEYRFAFRAPFARSFDLVLERPSLTTPRVYAKAYATVTREQWPAILLLCEAIRVARRGLMPSSDTIVLTAPRIDDLDTLLAASRRYSASWSWSRTAIGVCVMHPPRLHRARVFGSRALRRIEAGLGGRRS